jgi:hypothetical protein
VKEKKKGKAFEEEGGGISMLCKSQRMQGKKGTEEREGSE